MNIFTNGVENQKRVMSRSSYAHRPVRRIESEQTFAVQNTSACRHKRIRLLLRQKSVLLGVAVFVAMVANAFSQSDALWTGQVQCQLNVQNNGYVHQEVQTWTVTGSPTDDTKTVYPATWSVSGQGGLQRTQGGQVLAGRWNSSVPGMNAPLRIFVRASDGRLVIKGVHSLLVALGATNVVRQVGASQTNVVYAADEWILPIIEDVGTSMNISGTGTTVVTPTSMPMQPGTSGTATCKWNFTKGANGLKVVQPLGTVPTQNRGGRPVVNTPPTVGSPNSVSLTNAGPAVQAAPGGNTTGSSASVSNVAATRTPVSTTLPPTLTPNTGQQATGALGVTIDHWNWKAGGKPDFGPGISVICTGAISDSSAKVALSITPSAALGPRSVTFSSSDGPIKSNFTVTSRTAQDFLLDPDNAQQNQAAVLKLKGPIDASTPASAFQLDFGSGVRATNAYWNSTWNAERLDILVEPTATLGPRTVVLTMNGSTQCPIVSSDAATGKYTWVGQVNAPVSFYFLGTFTVNSAASGQTGQTTSSGTPPPDQTTGSTAGGTNSTGGGQQTVSQPAMDPPAASPGAGLVNLSWTTPAVGGSSIDSYQVETDFTAPARQWAITAPANTTAVALSACPYPGVSCGTPNSYRFRIRAHTAAGYGPYSSYTNQVRPLVSYTVDNVQAVWSTKGCTGCHTGANSPNLANGPTNSYNNVRAYVTPTPSSSKLLTCPTASTTCNTQVTHSQNFTISSQEYQLIMQWISDGAQP